MLGLSVSLLTAQAQDVSQTEEIKSQMGGMEVSQLTDAEEKAAKAEQILEKCASKQAEADKLRSQAKSEKGGKAKKLIKQAETIETPLIAQKITAYNLYDKANSTTYGIYAADIKKIAADATEKKRVLANNLTSEATEAWTAAEASKKKIPTGSKADQKQVLKLKEEAFREQQKAISLQIQTYAALLGWNEEPEQPVTQTYSAPAVEESTDDIQEQPAEVEKTDKIIFKVQIAADVVPLSLKRLREIYKSNDIISNEEDGGIHRYTVGYYNTYEEAAEAANRMGVKGAFVIAYRNGQRVFNINEIVPKN